MNAGTLHVAPAPTLAKQAAKKPAKKSKKKAAKLKQSKDASADAGVLVDYSQRPEVRAFVDDMVARHGFKRDELLQVFTRARYHANIVRLITPPTAPRARSWESYRRSHVDNLRVQGGVNLLRRYPTELARAEAEFGVPREIIAAIIGVETVYGRVMGDFRVIDALTTLAFDYPRRAPYFLSELEQYLLFARDQNEDVFGLRGSYAGAIGIPQFMPGSWRRYAVDFDGDGRIDLRNSFVDAIGSVGSFLKAHGWQAGQPIALSATIAATPSEANGASSDKLKALLDEGIEPKRKLAELTASGITTAGSEAHAQLPAALIDLVTPDQATEYLVGFANFYVITRYNRSSFYATSVWQLAQMVKKAAQ